MIRDVALVLAMALLFCSWAVQLGGISALSYTCNNIPEELASFQAQSGQGLFTATDLLSSWFYGYQPNCGKIFSFQWWLMVVQLVAIIGIMIMWAARMLVHHHSNMPAAWIGLLAILTAFDWMYTHRYNDLSWSLYDQKDSISTTYMRVNVALAGYLLLSIFNVVAIFALGALRPGKQAREEEPSKAVESAV